MKKGFPLPLWALPLLLAACSCRTEVGTPAQAVRESVRRETVYVPDTVYIEIPAQASERETADSASLLENGYASSEARIAPDGRLYHSLRLKAQRKAVGISKPVERRDSTVYRERTVVKEVERKAPWYEQAQIWGFRLLAAGLLMWLAGKLGNR